MRNRVLRTTFTVALMVALSPAPDANACSMMAFRGARHLQQHYFIALPTDRSLRAAGGLSTEFAKARRDSRIDGLSSPRDWRWWRVRIQHLIDSFRPSLPYGQVVRLERIGGPDSLALRSALAAARSEAVLVMWGLRADCGPALITHRGPHFTPGRALFTTAKLRERSGWVGNRPTFDVTTTDFPYDPSSPNVSERTLPLADYLSLYEALPEWEALQRDTASALNPLRKWVQTHPEHADHRIVLGELEMVKHLLQSIARAQAAGLR